MKTTYTLVYYDRMIGSADSREALIKQGIRRGFVRIQNGREQFARGVWIKTKSYPEPKELA